MNEAPEKEDMNTEPVLNVQCDSHVQRYDQETLRPPAFMRRTNRLSKEQINFIIRPSIEWVMPSKREEHFMSIIAAQDRNLPVEVSIKSSKGTRKEEFENMDKYEAWFVSDKYKVSGSIADSSMTVVSLEEVEAPAVKAAKPTKAVLKKGEEIKTKRAEQEKKDKKEAEKRRKGEIATDKKEEARARKVHARIDAAAKKGVKAKATKPEVAKKEAKLAAPKANGAVVRTGVRVTSGPKKGQEFASLAKFYDTMKLPYDSGFQKLRKTIKAQGKGTFEHEKHGKHELVGFVKEG